MTATSPSGEASHIYAVLKVDWPVAERVMVKLGALITTSTGGRPVGKRILQEILGRSIKAYGQVLYGGKAGKAPDHVRIGVFMNCLLQETHEFLHAEQEWTKEAEQTVADHIDQKELRSCLYELLVCDSLKEVLREARFEQAILDGRTATRN